MTDINELIDEAYEALSNAEANDYPQWDKDVDDIVTDLMDFHSEFETLMVDDVKRAVVGALDRYDRYNG